MNESDPIMLYDGVCGLCNRLVQFLLKHDKHGRLRFASLQGDFAAKVLQRHGIDPKDLDTLYVIENYEQPNERVLQRSNALLCAWGELGGFWRLSATVATVIPQALRDVIYRFVARNRYRVFGKYDSCMLPEPSQRSRFLDV